MIGDGSLDCNEFVINGAALFLLLLALMEQVLIQPTTGPLKEDDKF